MSNKSPNLTLLLNKCEALVTAGAGTLSELSKFLGKPAPRASEWVMQRKFMPNGEIALKMLQWCAAKTLEIAAAGADMQKAYRDAFRSVMEKHPVDAGDRENRKREASEKEA